MKVRSCKGFSLIELMVVIALLGIVLAIASPSFTRYRQNTNLKEATRALESDIALIKQRAVAENINYRINFIQASNNYILQKEDSANPGTFIALETKSPESFGRGIVISGDNLPSFAWGHTHVEATTRGTLELGSVTVVNGIGSRGKITTNLTGRMYVQFDMQ